MRRLVAATHNGHKLAEMKRLLAGLPVDLIGLESGREPPPESGETYLENARIKALHAVACTGLASFADDSGLEVDAMGGAPGIRSARFDGPDGTAQSRNAKLLAALEAVPMDLRGARFRAVIVLAIPGAGRGIEEMSFEGVVEGRIAMQPNGHGGFGYDPVFLLPELGTTVACLDPTRKDELSHRGRAMRAMAAWLAGNLDRLEAP